MHSIKANRNNKGIILIFTLLVMVIMLGVTGAMVIRAIDASRTAQRNTAGLQAFYEAESGLAYAYAEESQAGFNFYTHEDKDNDDPVTGPEVVTKGAITIAFVLPEPSAPAAFIEDSGEDANFYKVAGRNFKVKAYPEEDGDGDFTGVIVLHSQATVNGVTRTLEYRLGQENAYQYFFFYPGDIYVYDTTYDGRNFGSIHVNGDILVVGSPNFYYLVKLTAGTDGDRGYIKRYTRGQFTDLRNYSKDAFGNVEFSNSISNPWNLPWEAWTNDTYHFYTGNITFKKGLYNNSDPNNTRILSYYLEGDSADWQYDKYAGNRADANDRLPAHFKIGNEDLHNLALYELTGHQGSITLLDPNKNLVITKTIDLPGPGTITIPIEIDKEDVVYKKLYNGEPIVKRIFGIDIPINITWDEYWQGWINSHKNDYGSLHNGVILSNDSLDRDRDWERRFFLATYDTYYSSWAYWHRSGEGTPYRVNAEWWYDMIYGNDRSSGDLKDALVVDDNTGRALAGKYFLNTREQGMPGNNAWGAWLAANGLNVAGINETLVRDRSQGQGGINPGKVLGDNMEQSKIKKKAQNGGIYIGPVDTTGDGESDVFENPIGYGAIVNPIQFFNAKQPAFSGGKYKKSSVIKIDVKRLRDQINSDKNSDPPGELANFNGIIYVDLTGCTGLSGCPWATGDHFDASADGVMLVNAERLPDGGLSLGTPNNVFIKGNYNLDPQGCNSVDCNKNRDPDDSSVISWVKSIKPYLVVADEPSTINIDETGLKWQPAEVITQRQVYTLSEYFPEPPYMPMDWDHHTQWYDERDYVENQNYVDGDPYYSINNAADGIGWVPGASIPAGSKLKEWFDYYYTPTTGSSPPSSWTVAWVDQWLPGNTIFSIDKDGDGSKETMISSNDLRSTICWDQIEPRYDSTFSYTAVHGADPLNPANPTTPSQINVVNRLHIYNTALVTAHSTSPSVLEYWGSNTRVINGAFIQLPAWLGGTQIQLSVPGVVRYGRISEPQPRFNYETRYGRDSDQEDRPRVGLVFGADSSWREVKNANF